MENINNNVVMKQKVVKFNNNMLKEEEKNIIVKQFVDDKTGQNVAVFVLNYVMDKEPVQVVLGKLQFGKGDSDLVKKAKVIQEFLQKQLEQNKKEKNDFQYCSDLDRVCVKNGIPFTYTDEGVKIITNNIKEDIAIEKTYDLSEKQGFLNLICLNPDKKMDQYASEIKLRKSIREKTLQNRAINDAYKELEGDEINQFRVGRKIKNFKSEQNMEIIYSLNKALKDYIIDGKLRKGNENAIKEKQKLTLEEWLRIKSYYKEKENRNVQIDPSMVVGSSGEQSLEERFFRIKEKAIAIDIKRLLESEQNDYVEEKIKNEDQDENGESNKYSLINGYKTMFDFVKDGRDGNVRFSYSRTENGFQELKEIVKNQTEKLQKEGKNDLKPNELLKYLDLKENLLKNVNNRGKSFFDLYSENDQVKEFIEFVIKSSEREYAKQEEKDIYVEIYNDMIDQMIIRHQNCVKLYNKYAEKYGAERCPMPEQIFEKENENGEAR